MSSRLRRDLVLWGSLAAGPISWLCSFQAKFSWNQWACAAQTKLAPLLFALVAFGLTALGGVLAWRQWKAMGEQAAGEAGDAMARSRFMAIGGMTLSASFCLVILAQTVPDLILEVCQ